jgi:hypothetical protein
MPEDTGALVVTGFEVHKWRAVLGLGQNSQKLNTILDSKEDNSNGSIWQLIQR